MATKRTTVTEESDEETAVDEKEVLDEDVLRALTDLEGASEITWQVHRVGGINPGFCQPTLTTAELSIENIARRFGSGKYRVRGIRPDGTYYKGRTITVAESTASTAGPDVAAIIKTLQEGRGGTDAATMMPLLLAMMNNSTQIVTAALSRPQPEKKDFPWPTVLTTLPLLLPIVKDFFKSNADGDAMEKLLKQLTILEKLKGTEDGKGTSWPDVVRDALSSVPALLTRTTASAAQPVRVPTPIDARTSTRVPNADDAALEMVHTPDAIEPTQEVMTMEWLKKKMDELLQNAAANKNPDLRAEVFLDDLPVYIPETLVKTLLERDDWFEQLAQFDQRVLNYHGWFDTFRTCLLETMAPDDVPTDESATHE